jgi:hypothetical protein
MELGARSGIGEGGQLVASGHRRCRKSRSNRIATSPLASGRSNHLRAPAADGQLAGHDARGFLAGGEAAKRIEHGCQRAGRINGPNGVEETGLATIVNIILYATTIAIIRQP